MIWRRFTRGLIAATLLCASLNATAADGLTWPMPTFSDEVPWTPALKFTGASVGITYSTQLGIISRLGNGQLQASFIIVLSSKGSSTGPATITGLPVAARTSFYGDCNISYYSAMAGITTIKPYIGAGTAIITLAVPSATDNNNAVVDTAFTATTAIVGHCSYAA